MGPVGYKMKVDLLKHTAIDAAAPLRSLVSNHKVDYHRVTDRHVPKPERLFGALLPSHFII